MHELDGRSRDTLHRVNDTKLFFGCFKDDVFDHPVAAHHGRGSVYETVLWFVTAMGRKLRVATSPMRRKRCPHFDWCYRLQSFSERRSWCRKHPIELLEHVKRELAEEESPKNQE